jgi:hypothetical protein
MTHSNFMISVLVAAMLVAWIPGRIIGQIVFELEEEGYPLIAASISIFSVVMARYLGFLSFGFKGLLCIVLAFPIFWLAKRAGEFLAEAPEMNEPLRSWDRPEEIRQKDLSFFRGLGIFAGTVWAAVACVVFADTHGVGASIAAVVVSPLSAVPALGGCFLFFGMVGLLIVLCTRLCHGADAVTRRLNEWARCNKTRIVK